MYKINNKDVISADLLSVEEAINLPTWIRANGDRWWLRSQGDDSNQAALVYRDGDVDDHDLSFYIDCVAPVRPSLKISNSPDLKIGETVEIFGLLAQYVNDGKILLCESIFHSRFDKQSNVYETSEVKKKLDEWFKDMRGRKEDE